MSSNDPKTRALFPETIPSDLRINRCLVPLFSLFRASRTADRRATPDQRACACSRGGRHDRRRAYLSLSLFLFFPIFLFLFLFSFPSLSLSFLSSAPLPHAPERCSAAHARPRLPALAPAAPGSLPSRARLLPRPCTPPRQATPLGRARAWARRAEPCTPRSRARRTHTPHTPPSLQRPERHVFHEPRASSRRPSTRHRLPVPPSPPAACVRTAPTWGTRPCSPHLPPPSTAPPTSRTPARAIPSPVLASVPAPPCRDAGRH